jgi:hypothetical protein
VGQVVGGADDAFAAAAALRIEDLPGTGWVATADGDDDGGGSGGPGDELLDAALTGFPDEAVVASATSPRFTRDDAIAWSVTWVLSSAEATARAAARLRERSFAAAFVDSVAAALEPEIEDEDETGGAGVLRAGSGEGAVGGGGGSDAGQADAPSAAVDEGPFVLGAVTDAPAAVPGAPGTVRHRARVTAGTGDGALVVHLDLVALAGQRAATLLVLGDSPAPPPDELVAAVVGALVRRR